MFPLGIQRWFTKFQWVMETSSWGENLKCSANSNQMEKISHWSPFDRPCRPKLRVLQKLPADVHASCILDYWCPQACRRKPLALTGQLHACMRQLEERVGGSKEKKKEKLNHRKKDKKTNNAKNA